MKRVCSYCKKHYGDKEPLEENFITHGICAECFEWLRQNNHQSLREYVNKFDSAILVVDSNIDILIANNNAKKLLGKGLDKIEGYTGGDAIECEYARLPGGCGRTVHCKPCTIRNSVTETYATGRSIRDAHAYQNIFSGNQIRKIHFLISTERKGDLILLKIEPVDDQES